MRICILGWYGTETLGDRAILDGIIKIFESRQKNNIYYLGSLRPFFSEHTLALDGACYCTDNGLNIKIFNENNPLELKNYITKSDYVIMGGGPIMDISQILNIQKGFKIAKKHNIKTGLIGCGFGPFHYSYYEKIANDILELSDVKIFRDDISLKRAIECNSRMTASTMSDPAIISALVYREKNDYAKKDYISINFRDTRFKIYQDRIFDVQNDLYKLTATIASEFPRVVLIPMHTFYLGGDDRAYFAELFQDKKISNVTVKYQPQSLYELYNSFAEAYGCIGMRYHAVVLQTVLNGNNIILDYTEENEGKISGFLREIEGDFYKNRYTNISHYKWLDELDCNQVLKENRRYSYNVTSESLIEKYLKEMF